MSSFERSERFQQELPDILIAIAVPRVPDYTDDLLALTAATRQRPRWTFLERWLPMGVIVRRPTLFPTIPLRPIIVAAVLIALVATGLLLVGSQRRVPPPPFGPARNGALVFDDHGDIAVRDSVSGRSRTLVAGPGDDFDAGFTRDGTHLIFLRRTAGAPGSANELNQVFIADADGSHSRSLSGDLAAPLWLDWSPDDQQLVIEAGPASGERLYLIDVKQGGGPRRVDLGGPMTATFPSFLGPAGAEIVFRGVTRTGSGIYAIRAEGSGLRALTPTDGRRDYDFQFPQPSPDGRYVTYSEWDEIAEVERIHLVDMTTGADRSFHDTPGLDQGWGTFSPDSRSIMFTRYSDGTRQIMVEPVDRTTAAVPLGPTYPIGDDVGGTFSPDGRFVIVKDSDQKESRLIDAATGGDGEVLTWSADGITGWQRLAP